MIRRFLPLLSILLLALSQTSPADLVKKSQSGICHDSTSTSYSRTKNYTAYGSLNACLQSGGRLPKSRKASAPAANTASPSSGKYRREAFGRGWDDADHNCMNTRHELLLKQSTSTVDTGSNRCTVNRGRWFDPYTGKTFYNARELDIDHLVPLKWAWDHGADRWTNDKRLRFANDEVNLFAVQASVKPGERCPRCFGMVAAGSVVPLPVHHPLPAGREKLWPGSFPDGTAGYREPETAAVSALACSGD